MRLAVRRRLAAYDIEVGIFFARSMCATAATDINHAVCRVFLAEHPPFVALVAEAGWFHARVVRATPRADVHHASLSMFLAVHWCPGALDIKA